MLPEISQRSAFVPCEGLTHRLYVELQVTSGQAPASQLDTCSVMHVGLDSYTMSKSPCLRWFLQGLVLFCDLVYYLVNSHGMQAWSWGQWGCVCGGDQRKPFTAFCWQRSIKISSSARQEEQTRPWTSSLRSFLTRMPFCKGGAVTLEGHVLAHQDILMHST